MASVKANAYGHGAVQVAREAERCGVHFLGVAFLDEAIQLRDAGLQLPILVLGFVSAQGLAIARERNITIALFREDILAAAASLPPSEHKLRVHVKVDTGMGRLGIPHEDEAVSFIERAMQQPNIEVEGLFTHYARADEADKSYTKLQYERFTRIQQQLNARHIHIPIIHAANSAAGMETPQYAGAMVRLGISMYGLYPSEEVNKQTIALQPVLSLKTEVVMVKQTPADWGISYGSRYVTNGQEWIGTLPIGYADGYSRMLNGKAYVLVREQRMPVRGTICMDQCMISVPDEAVAGDEVVIIGAQGQDYISVEDIARQLGTINYEVTCMISTRVPRIYYRHGKAIFVENYLCEL